MEVRGKRIRSRLFLSHGREAIETWPIEMKVIFAEQGLPGLLEIPGVGSHGKIVELVEKGSFDARERLGESAETPASVLDLLVWRAENGSDSPSKFKIASLWRIRKLSKARGRDG